MFRPLSVPASRRLFSTTRRKANYHETLKNLNIGSHTRVIYQGFTGKQATINAKQTIEYGTNIVGGVTPGKSGTHLDLPLYPTVKEAVTHLKPDASAIFVAAPFAGKAIEEAIEAEIPLVVAVAEHVPLHDMYRVHAMLKTQSKTRLVGANCPGILNARGKCRVGFMPHLSFTPGGISIVAKSGTLSYEAVASTSRAGLGQNLVVGMGGDPLAGTTLRDGVEFMWDDPNTEGIIVIGEIGGRAEMEVVEFLEEKKRQGGKMKPIMGLVAGKIAPAGTTMGHAGAYFTPGDPTVEEKIRAWENAGIEVVTHPGEFGERMAARLGRPLPDAELKPSGGFTQTRSFHSGRYRPTVPPPAPRQQVRSYTFGALTTHRLLDDAKIPNSQEPALKDAFPLTLGMSRAEKSPELKIGDRSLIIPYLTGPSESDINTLHKSLSLPESTLPTFTALITSIFTLYKSSHLRTLTANLALSPHLTLHTPSLETDPSSPLYPPSTHPLGIVYHKLPPPPTPGPLIGTLVNGAGLAMNTLDALVHYGGRPLNFLDTGGKATEETVVGSLKLLIAEPEAVDVVFVNIFGGLTRGAVIARGVVQGVKTVREEGWAGEVVVRIRGTEEDEGQALVRESGLEGVWSFDGLEEAARKAIEIADRKWEEKRKGREGDRGW